MKKVSQPYKGWALPVSIFLFFGYVGLRIGTCMELSGNALTLDVLSEAGNDVFSFKPVSFSVQSLRVAFYVGAFAWMAYETYRSRQHKHMQEYAYGSASWNDPNYTKKLREKEPDQNWIFTNSEIVSMDMSKTGRNRNCVIIGRPGTGKTRYWLIPNVLNAGNETLVITDPKEELVKATGHALKEKGFDIKVFNVKSKWRSNHYNPLDYIRKVPDEAYLLDLDNDNTRKEELEKLKREGRNIAEDDVMSLINAIMANTKSDTIESNTGDPFWEKAEMVFLQALFYYTIFKMPKEKRNFKTILELIRKGEPDNEGRSELTQIFEDWEREDPSNIGVKQWKHFQVSAKSPKMMSTIIMTASARLAPFNMQEVSDLVMDDSMELDRIGKPIDLIERNEAGEIVLDSNNEPHRIGGKVAYFIVTNPNDSTFNFLATLMYTQIFNIIDRNAEENGGRLATPTNVWMDEFRQLGTIPRFLENWAYVRGLNCGITVILQSLSQFKKIYKDEWETGLDCCDYKLFLGSQSKETLEYMSALLGKQTLAVLNDSRTYSKQGSTSKSWQMYGRELATVDELAEMEKGWGILQMSGTKPFYSKLYQMEKDPQHAKLWESWTEIKGQSDPAFKQSREWKENHEKYYDHLSVLNRSRSRAEAQRYFEEALQTMKKCGIQAERMYLNGELKIIHKKDLHKWKDAAVLK